MPSYRSILTIADLRPGHGPQDVEAAAREAVTASTTLEAFQVDVVRGEPRVTVRFTGADDADAGAVHSRTLAGVRAVAVVPRQVLAKVVSGRSVPIPAAGA
ncbi:FMN-dependent dehydrogenase [Actinomyces sp. MRS3W]|uniref:FMN-dependent dehydrogenase n=1 Tax=Actinomyces sp. MRS3W TaxID=2800796 RepID=UPI0028FD09F6|nr:FMN-dependent dehydrogenase [Actinomyces sp. MRS3W]MDU0348838.1 FMN-dependent dehydrogenase [Actinomyces sp. MRS3W]